jgi:YgiT-type zinc finger domain-containing protein
VTSEAQENAMKCHVCSGALKPAVADLPFALEANRIVILKGLLVLQCGPCGA